MIGEDSAGRQRRSAAVDVGLGLGLAAVSAGALFWLIPAEVSTEAVGTDVAPAFMAQLSASVVLALSLLMVAVRLLRERPAGGAREALRLSGEVAGLTLGAVAVMALLQTAGFVPTAALMILAGGILARHRPRWWLVPLAIAFPLVVDFGAWHIFVVDLP